MTIITAEVLTCHAAGEATEILTLLQGIGNGPRRYPMDIRGAVRSVYRRLIRRDVVVKGFYQGADVGELRRIIRGQSELYRQGLLQQERYSCPKRLNAYGQRVFSQHGEDGIIAEIFRRIGTDRRTFLEIGVGDGIENNTAFLLLQGWKGHWVEGSPRECERIRGNLERQLSDGSLRLIEAMVARENVLGLLREHGVPDSVDLLSVDVDLTTHDIWEAIGEIGARLVVVEYNPQIPAWLDWKAEPPAGTAWDGSMYMGAGLKAIERIGKSLGFNLVGCDLSGANAFFVRGDLCADKFHDPFTAEEHYEPTRYWMDFSDGHLPSPLFFQNMKRDSGSPGPAQ
jgi:hypothetical protein